MAYLKCTDLNNTGNYLVMNNGKIGIWRVVAGVSRLFTPLTQTSSTPIVGGTTIQLSERYENTPTVFAHPSSLPIYEGSASSVDQKIVVTQPSVTALGEGKYNLSAPQGTLSSVASTNKFVPVTYQYRSTVQNYEGTDRYWEPIYIPGINGATVSATVEFYQYKSMGYSKKIYYTSSISLQVGISVTRYGTVAWGASDTRIVTNGAILTASTPSGTAGSYLHFYTSAHITGNTHEPGELTDNGYSFWHFENYQFLGASVSTQAVSFVNGGNFDCVVSGR